MRYLLTFLLTLKCVISSAQIEKNNKVIDTVDVKYSIYKLFNDFHLEQDSLNLKISFSSIDKSEFETYKELYSSSIDTISNTISRSENSFSIIAADTIFKFASQIGRTHYYGGFYPTLNCHLVKISGDGICETFLIDQESAIGLALPGIYDNSCYQPRISPDKTFLMIYGTCPYGDLCFEYYDHITTIMIINISSKKSISELKSFRLLSFNDWSIAEVFWIDNDFIVLKGFDAIESDENKENEQMKEKYVKGKIQW